MESHRPPPGRRKTYPFNTFHLENVMILLENCEFHDAQRDRHLYEDARSQMLRMDLHAHAQVELFIVLRGAETITLSDHQITLRENDLMLVAPQILHRADMVHLENGEWINLRFSYASIKSSSSIDLYGLLAELLSQPYYLQRNSPIAREAVSRMRGYCLDHPHLRGGCLYELLLDMYERCRREGRSGASDPWVADTENLRLSLLDHIISDQYMMPLSIDGLASRLSLSKRQLERVIKRHYGMPLRSLMIAKRIGGAKAMLRSTEKTVQDIALEVGYTSLSCFFSAFKKVAGMTPTQYRKLCQGKEDPPDCP